MNNKNHVKCEVVKITAVGVYKTFITIRFPKYEFTFYTCERDLYNYLKSLGVPTGQSERRKE